MKHTQRTWLTAITALFLGALNLANTYAAGLLIADGGLGGVLEIKEHTVQVTINNGVAVTKVTQVFHNTEKRQVEALYTFPVPKGASVANFSMWINGKEMVGEVLEKKRAREIYDSYKRQRRDPGLLEQADYRTFEMRIFPIAPDADQKVEVTYYQELDFDHDWATYVYPLATATRRDVDSRTTGKFAISFEVKSVVPIAELESTSHPDGFAIAKQTQEYWQASLETKSGSLAKDVVLAYHVVRPHTGIDLITSKNGNEDGFFCLTLTAGEDLAQHDQGMDYVFVLDVSGSMGDDGKLLLSKDSIGAFVNELGDKDRFEVLTFSVQPNPFFKQLAPVTADTRQQAAAFLTSQRALGGTVLNPAITTAYKYASPDRTLNVVILSDGLTEQQERRALLELIGQRPRNTRVFCIGVGNDVNRPLLEQLAQDSGGLASFLSHGDNFTRAAKAFRRKLMRPAATNLQLDFGGLQVFDVEPKTLPNLYHGAPVRVYGRYVGAGTGKVGLRADVNGVELKMDAKLDFPANDPANPEIERMWAWKRVDQLLKLADRTESRDQVIPEIVKLGETYSIVTEYTSFLVLENDAEYQRWKIDRRNVLRTQRDRQAQQDVRAQLEAIRNRALADIGPEAAKTSPASSSQPVPQVGVPAQVPQQVASAPHPVNVPVRSNSRQSVDWGLGGGGGGSGPVGPLFVIIAGWIARRKNHRG
jgi:Ca-activated chloride channel family protein